MIDEVRNVGFRKLTQTIVYIPHFISWVVVASIFTLFLSPQSGLVNAILTSLGMEPIYFLASDTWWRIVFYLLNLWKETGWGTIIYLPGLCGEYMSTEMQKQNLCCKLLSLHQYLKIGDVTYDKKRI